MDAVKPNKLSVALTAGWLILPLAAYVVAVALNAVFNIPGVSEYLLMHCSSNLQLDLPLIS